MNKKEQAKQIICQLLNMKKVGYFSKDDIEKAIMFCRDIADPRAIQNWFNYLWKFQYFLQPEPNIYHLNIAKISELEVKVPLQIDTKQKRLGEFNKPLQKS